MLASRIPSSALDDRHGRLYALSERMFDGLLRGYEWALSRVLDHPALTLATFLATTALTGLLFVMIPKGFFPQQDTGLITGISEAAQDISFADMMRKQEAIGAIIQADPAVATIAMAVGVGGSTAATNNGRMFITLKPRDERTATATGCDPDGRARSSRS